MLNKQFMLKVFLNKRPNNEQPIEYKTNESPTNKETVESAENISAIQQN